MPPASTASKSGKPVKQAEDFLWVILNLLSMVNGTGLRGHAHRAFPQGNKSGVYNAAMRKMVINVAYDSINIMQDGTLAASRYGVVMKYTTEGYRVIE